MYPETAKEARASGFRFYMTGRPCPSGHVAPRYESTRTCAECAAIAMRQRTSDQLARYEKRRVERKTQKDKDKTAARKRKRRNGDPLFAFVSAVRSNTTRAFSRKGMKKHSRTEALLGCTVSEFRTHIERQFLPGMTWENRALWHIDHIVALATAKNADEVAALCHHTNLRPFWKQDNLKKGSKTTHLI